MAKNEPSTDQGAPTDEQLVERFLAGDRTAFDTLVGRFRDRAFWVAWNMMRDHEEAMDAAQEAFVRAFHSASTFDTSLKFSTWFFRIVVNHCIDTLRKKKLRRAVSTEETGDVFGVYADPGADASAVENRKRVWRVLQALPPAQRALLVLRDIQGLSNIEIAKIYRCNQATARWRLHRARLKFREIWEDLFGEWEE